MSDKGTGKYVSLILRHKPEVIKTRRRAVLQNRRKQDKAQRESRSVFRSGVVNMMEVRLAERFIRVLSWAKSLDPGRYHVAYTSFMNQRNDPPEIMWITKKYKDEFWDGIF